MRNQSIEIVEDFTNRRSSDVSVKKFTFYLQFAVCFCILIGYLAIIIQIINRVQLSRRRVNRVAVLLSIIRSIVKPILFYSICDAPPFCLPMAVHKVFLSILVSMVTTVRITNLRSFQDLLSPSCKCLLE